MHVFLVRALLIVGSDLVRWRTDPFVAVTSNWVCTRTNFPLQWTHQKLTSFSVKQLLTMYLWCTCCFMMKRQCSMHRLENHAFLPLTIRLTVSWWFFVPTTWWALKTLCVIARCRALWCRKNLRFMWLVRHLPSTLWGVCESCVCVAHVGKGGAFSDILLLWWSTDCIYYCSCTFNAKSRHHMFVQHLEDHGKCRTLLYRFMQKNLLMDRDVIFTFVSQSIYVSFRAQEKRYILN